MVREALGFCFSCFLCCAVFSRQKINKEKQERYKNFHWSANDLVDVSVLLYTSDNSSVNTLHSNSCLW